MKLLLIALLFVGIFFLYQTQIASVQKSYEFCIEQALTDKEDSTQLACSVKKQVYSDLYSCVEKVQQSSITGSLLYSSTGTKNKVEILVEEHNKACPQSSVATPAETLYLGN